MIYELHSKDRIIYRVATAINGLTFAAQAQFCADPSHTAATKDRLDQIAQSQGIPINQVGRAFQNFALATIRPATPIPENFRFFPSPARSAATGGAIST